MWTVGLLYSPAACVPIAIRGWLDGKRSLLIDFEFKLQSFGLARFCISGIWVIRNGRCNNQFFAARLHVQTNSLPTNDGHIIGRDAYPALQDVHSAVIFVSDEAQPCPIVAPRLRCHTRRGNQYSAYEEESSFHAFIVKRRSVTGVIIAISPVIRL